MYILLGSRYMYSSRFPYLVSHGHAYLPPWCAILCLIPTCSLREGRTAFKPGKVIRESSVIAYIRGSAYYQRAPKEINPSQRRSAGCVPDLGDAKFYYRWSPVAVPGFPIGWRHGH